MFKFNGTNIFLKSSSLSKLAKTLLKSCIDKKGLLLKINETKSGDISSLTNSDSVARFAFKTIKFSKLIFSS